MTTRNWYYEKYGSVSSCDSEAYHTQEIDIAMLNEFAKLKCEEQRRICLHNATVKQEWNCVYGQGEKWTAVVDEDSILFAPEPNLEDEE